MKSVLSIQLQHIIKEARARLSLSQSFVAYALGDFKAAIFQKLRMARR